MGTIKQQKAVDLLINGEMDNKKEMLEKVGYSKGITKSPSRVINSKGFQECLKEKLPDNYKAQKHKKFLDSENETVGLKALDLAYKVGGDYAPEKSISANLNLDVEVKQSQESIDLVDEYEEKVKNMLKEKK